MKTLILWTVGGIGIVLAAVIGIRELLIRDLVRAMQDLTKSEGHQAFMKLGVDASVLHSQTGQWPQDIRDLLDHTLFPRPAAMARVFSIEREGAKTVLVWNLKEGPLVRLPLRTYQEMIDEPRSSAPQSGNPFDDPVLVKPPATGVPTPQSP